MNSNDSHWIALIKTRKKSKNKNKKRKRPCLAIWWGGHLVGWPATYPPQNSTIPYHTIAGTYTHSSSCVYTVALAIPSWHVRPWVAVLHWLYTKSGHRAGCVYLLADVTQCIRPLARVVRARPRSTYLPWRAHTHHTQLRLYALRLTLLVLCVCESPLPPMTGTYATAAPCAPTQFSFDD